ncbi:hypothetical protein GQ600_2620 [Phytophthora cactorum]|nr:hypothetical protein GQ600_2620 [Phytophthora cactorum]
MRYYDGRFEHDTALIDTLFNQLQRHTAIRKAAQVGSTRASVLLGLGELANSQEFREVLLTARNNPDSAQTKRVNAHFLRLLSLVGGCVPFSPFERATNDTTGNWGFKNPLWNSAALALRMVNKWNRSDIIFQQKRCSQNDLPETVRSCARGRLTLSNSYPALSARVFERCTRQIFNDIVLCKVSSDTRLSRNYSSRIAGAFGTIAVHAAVVEPQADGRLHIHISLFGSKFNPALLSRMMSSPKLCNRAAKWLESVWCSSNVHEWRNNCFAQLGKLPKAFEIPLPDAPADFTAFLHAAQMRAASTNFHAHTSTCFKGKRGKYMSSLARPAGVFEGVTGPLVVIRERKGNISLGVLPVVSGHGLRPYMINSIEDDYSYDDGQAFRSHCEGQPAPDTSAVETILLLAVGTGSHTNASVIDGQDSGDMIEECQQAYMTKDEPSLKGAASALLSTAEHNLKYPSRADDAHSDLRIGKYLATRTINRFSGSHEGDGLCDHRPSIAHFERFVLVYFPYTLADYLKRMRRGKPDCKPKHKRDNSCG